MTCRHFLVAILRSVTGEGGPKMGLNSSQRFHREGTELVEKSLCDHELAVGKPCVRFYHQLSVA